MQKCYIKSHVRRDDFPDLIGDLSKRFLEKKVKFKKNNSSINSNTQS